MIWKTIRKITILRIERSKTKTFTSRIIVVNLFWLNLAPSSRFANNNRYLLLFECISNDSTVTLKIRKYAIIAIISDSLSKIFIEC